MQLTSNQYGSRTWYDIIFKQRNLYIEITLVIFSVAFLSFLSNISIPIWPVPVTGQTLGIFMIAFFFGSKRGLLSLLTYTLAGLAGFTVFSSYSSGLKHLIGPTGGYILGFLAMVFFVGFMIEKGYGRTKMSVLVCMLVGEIILYTFGLTWLWVYLGNPGFLALLSAGFFPFIIGDAIKIGIAIALFPYIWKLGKNHKRNRSTL